MKDEITALNTATKVRKRFDASFCLTDLEKKSAIVLSFSDFLSPLESPFQTQIYK